MEAGGWVSQKEDEMKNVDERGLVEKSVEKRGLWDGRRGEGGGSRPAGSRQQYAAQQSEAPLHFAE